MKKTFVRLLLLPVVLVSSLLASCTDGPKLEEGKDFSVSLGQVLADRVELCFTTSSAGRLEVAYLIDREPIQIKKPAILFNVGKKLQVSNGEKVLVTDNKIEPESHHHIAVAAKLENKEYSDIFQLEFTTGKFDFKEILTVLDTYLDGYKLRMTVPQDVKDNDNALRYVFGNLAIYNKVLGMGQDDTDMLILNGGAHTRYVKNDTTFVLTTETVLEKDENGKPIVDETGQKVEFHSSLVPGEPAVVLAGEFAWGDAQKVAGLAGWGEGYFDAQYDKTAGEWTGAFAKKVFTIQPPEELDCTMDIKIHDVTPINAHVTFFPSDNISFYLYTVLDQGTYDIMMQLLDDKDNANDDPEDLLQWFITSELAFLELGVQNAEEGGEIDFEVGSIYINNELQENTDYHVLCVAMNEDGTAQKLFRDKFTTASKVLPAPVITVTAKPQNKKDPYNSYFNIKAENKDVVRCFYGCNDVREWMLAIGGPDKDYPNILMGNNEFSAKEIGQINSDAGLDVSFPSLDGATTRLVVYGCNEEHTFNPVSKNDTDCPALADYTTVIAPAVPFVESDLYDALAGEWTATAKVKVSENSEDGTAVSYEVEHKSRVVIGKKTQDLPATLPQEVYDLYAKGNTDKAGTDALYAELKSECEKFTTDRLADRNRILCEGFVDFDYFKNPGRLDCMTPYDLFTSPTYSSYDVPQILNDFGPKWYLEVQKGGKVIAPFHSAYNPPMAKWGETFYLGGYSQESNIAFIDSNKETPGFPVEISADRNTITIKPLIVKTADKGNVPHYANPIMLSPMTGGITLIAPVVSEIVLTRGWTPAPSKKMVKGASVRPVVENASLKTIDGRDASLPVEYVYKSLTDVTGHYVKDAGVCPVITADALDNALNEYIKEAYGITIAE